MSTAPNNLTHCKLSLPAAELFFPSRPPSSEVVAIATWGELNISIAPHSFENKVIPNKFLRGSVGSREGI